MMEPAFTDKRVTRTITVTSKHPTPFIVFHDGKMVKTSGRTRFKPGDKVRVFYDVVKVDVWYVVHVTTNRRERWDWEER